MRPNVFQQFVDWGTRLRNKARTDPFFLMRIQLMCLYFAIGAVIFMFLGWFISSIRFEPILQTASLTEPGSAAQLAYAHYQQEVFWRRFLLTVAFIVATYFVTDFALRPIRKSVELQQQFFGTISHELRTPLTIMKNEAEVALRNPQFLNEEKTTSILTSMLEETERISHTINFLLGMSSLSIQKKIPDMRSCSLADLANETRSLLEKAAHEKGVALSWKSATDVFVRGNPAALRGVFMNLGANAIRHTPSGGSVSLLVKEHKNGVEVSVTDTGSGIHAKDLPYIFEPFYQATNAGYKNEKGSLGLGLSLVREVSRLHGARISVESIVGKGTRFSVLFKKV